MSPIVQRLSRRRVLRGLGGVALALPFLEGFVPRAARAQRVSTEPFAVFLRQANGVAQQNGSEPERFFPRTLGALTTASMADRAVAELEAHRSRLLILKNVNYGSYDWGDGHAAGALHALTARPPVTDGAGGSAEAAGESLDHRIGRELNADGRGSLFMYAGRNGGWLNGPCISYRGSGVRRSAHDNASGPPHAVRNVPWILAGGASGFLKTGQYVELTPGSTTPNHGRLLNSIGSAVGLRTSAGEFISDFGDPALNRTFLDELRA